MQVTPSIFSVFCSEQPFYGIYATWDSHVVKTLYNLSRGCLPVKMASINLIRSIDCPFFASGHCKLRSEVYVRVIRLLINLYFSNICIANGMIWSIFGINTASDISKLLFETILKYRKWYLCQISSTNHAIICLYYYPQKVCNFHT